MNGVTAETWCPGAVAPVLHLPRLSARGHPVTMPGTDTMVGVVTTKLLVITRCGRRARPPRCSDTDEITAVCPGCVDDALTAFGDQSVAPAVRAVLSSVADGLLGTAGALRPSERKSA